MKQSKLILALLSTFAASSAFAGVPYTWATLSAARDAGSSSFQETWVSGASAPTSSIYQAWAEGCDAGTESVYTSNATAAAPGSIGNFSAYVCARSGKASIMYHSVDLGSFTAYGPYLPTGKAPDGTTDLPMKLTRVQALGSGTEVCTNVAADKFTKQDGVTEVPVFKGCPTNQPGVSVTPDVGPTKPAGGFSDVEAALWGKKVTAYGAESNIYVNQAFGLAVTIPLYRALQVSQGKLTQAQVDGGVTDTLFSQDLAPNITKDQYTAIARQNGPYAQSWATLLPNYTGSDRSSKVQIVRRTALSGTQAASNAYFMDNPCKGTAAFTPGGSGNSTGNLAIYEKSSTGNVKNSLTYIGGGKTENNSVTAGTDTNKFAIGVMSLENNWRKETSSSSNGYRFVKLDGVHPESGDVYTADAKDGFARSAMISNGYNFVYGLRQFIGKTSQGADAFGRSLIGNIGTKLKAPSSSALCEKLPRGLSFDPNGSSGCTNEVMVNSRGDFNCTNFHIQAQ
jgi:hypothetical protein